MAGGHGAVTAASLKARGDAVLDQYAQNRELVREVQDKAAEDLVPLLVEELELDDAGKETALAFLRDNITVFRFCRRARFSLPAALKLLHATLDWRLTNTLSSLPTVSPLYLRNPVFFFHPSLCDRFGRPCGILNLQHVSRTEDGALEPLKDFIRLAWEMGRRWLTDLSRKGDQERPTLQMVLIVDLEGAGMSNLEVELLPFFMDLLKNHFPGMVGAIFVLNYGWMYAGMWQLSKRVLPNTALERILFPTKSELLEFFDEDHLLVEHGGSISYSYNPSNPILVKYGHSISTNYVSPRPSRTASSESLHSDAYQSAPGTPRPLSRRSSRLGMTSTDHRSFKHASSQQRDDSVLARVTSFAELQDRLAQTQKEIDSGSSGEDEADEMHEDYVESPDDSERFEQVGWSGSTTPARSPRVVSRPLSRNASRNNSPTSRRSEALAQHAARFAGAHHVSPYNTSNPFYGYPAFVPPTHLDPTGVPRPHYPRRRKRDLLRTLTYLAVLRFLALNRSLRARLARLSPFTSSASLEKEKEKDRERASRSPKVHWEEATRDPAKTQAKRVVDIRLVYLLLAIIIVRSPKCLHLLRLVLVDLPARVVPNRLQTMGKEAVQIIKRPLVARGRKRDAIRSALGLGRDGVTRRVLAELAGA